MNKLCIECGDESKLYECMECLSEICEKCSNTHYCRMTESERKEFAYNEKVDSFND